MDSPSGYDNGIARDANIQQYFPNNGDDKLRESLFEIYFVLQSHARNTFHANVITTLATCECRCFENINFIREHIPL